MSEATTTPRTESHVFDKGQRAALAKMVGRARERLKTDLMDQLRRLGFQDDGTVLDLDQIAGLDEAERAAGRELRALLDHFLAAEAGKSAASLRAAYDRLLREVGFTTLNRLVALRLAEERELIVPSVSGGFTSSGFQVYERVTNNALGSRIDTYRAYVESLYDELAVDLPALFDHGNPESRIFPSERCLEDVLGLINSADLSPLWKEDETIGWVYQYYNDPDERKRMRDASAAPRNSRELAVRNQFFTPRYVVEFLTDNTLGRTWYEMRQGETRLRDDCRYLVRRKETVFLKPAETQPTVDESSALLRQYVPYHAKKDPRDLKILDPACGSGHFLLYAYDLLETIYEEAWTDPDLGPPLWRDFGWIPPINSDNAHELADPETVKFRAAGLTRCFSCGKTDRVSDAYFILADLYHTTYTSGRPMVYCARCVEEKRDRISATMPLTEFDFARALKQGWFAHSTGTMFLQMTGVFEYALTSRESTMFETLSAAADESSLAIIRVATPVLILRHNLHGIEIDPRARQVAGMALWLRAQRGYQLLGIKGAERPPITESHLILAEPMPGERDLLDEYVKEIDPRLRDLVKAIWEKMRLAGDAGSLLKIEAEMEVALQKARTAAMVDNDVLIQHSLFGPNERPHQLTLPMVSEDERAFWSKAESALLDALRAYASHSASGQATRRRLFRNDAERGFAFVDLNQKHFDVVLMNPPFGEASRASKPYIEKAYPRSKNDVYAAFVERWLGRLATGGSLGAITSRTGFFLSSFQKWREEILLKEARVTVFADLGAGVLDSAMVETAAYCLKAEEQERPMRLAGFRGTPA